MHFDKSIWHAMVFHEGNWSMYRKSIWVLEICINSIWFWYGIDELVLHKSVHVFAIAIAFKVNGFYILHVCQSVTGMIQNLAEWLVLRHVR